MTRLIQWLLGLERIDLAEDQPLMFRFASPPAEWVMLVGAVIAAGIVYWLYRREAVRSRWRWTLGVVRFSLIMTVLFIIGRPMVVLRRTQADPSVVAVLVDRSASMNATDEVAGSAGASRLSRWERTIELMSRQAGGLLPTLLSAHEVRVSEFGESVAPICRITRQDEIFRVTNRLKSDLADATRTSISQAVEQVLAGTLDERLAAVIVITDGRQTNSASIERLVADARSRSVPVHAIAAGSVAPRKDIAIENVRSEERVTLHDSVLIRASLLSKGYDKPVDVETELKDVETSEVISRQRVATTPDAAVRPVEVVYKPTRSGRRMLELSAVHLSDEDNASNNSFQFAIEAVDQKIGVLYVEGEPRFEYRYLKNLLRRETTIESSCLLLSASSSFPQEGSRPIRQFPQSVEELRQYDVIVLGDVDVRGDWLSLIQQRMILDFVSQQAGGVAFIAGPTNMPHRLTGSPLEKLLPVRIDPLFSGEYESEITSDFSAELTREGREHPIFRFASATSPEGEAVPSGWYWFARVLSARPAAEVLAQHPTIGTAAGPMPLVVLGRFGRGRTFYAGSDEIWRWRQFSGEMYYDHVWLQALRTLARNRKLGGACPWRLETDRREYEPGQTVSATLTRNESSAAIEEDEVELVVRDSHNSLVHRTALRADSSDRSALSTQFVPSTTGLFTLSVDGGNGSECELAATIRVAAKDAEQEHLEADYEFLRILATRTQGRFLTIDDDAAALAGSIPSRERRIVDDVEEPIWDSPLLILLFVALAFSEWTARRLLGMS